MSSLVAAGVGEDAPDRLMGGRTTQRPNRGAERFGQERSAPNQTLGGGPPEARMTSSALVMEMRVGQARVVTGEAGGVPRSKMRVR
jgi:hypothetical protein